MSAELKAHFALPVTTICHLIKMTRTDGEVLAVTPDHDQDLVFDGVTYKSAFGIIPSTAETSAAMNVDTMDARGALMALGVNEADIIAGLWDLCDVRVLRVNYSDLTQGCEKVKRFTFGEISIGRGTYSAEFRGITQKLQQTLGDVVTPACNANLFDTRCGIAETEGTWKFSGKAVTTATSQRAFTISTLAQAADFFTAGKVTFTTGLNVGLSMEIKQHSSGGVFELQESMPYAISIGDQMTVWAGCRKRASEDCNTKFSNIIRFRGFPSLPGQDQMFKGV
jgi:uncharacterized phage protein (TIGR02218 family)